MVDKATLAISDKPACLLSTTSFMVLLPVWPFSMQIYNPLDFYLDNKRLISGLFLIPPNLVGQLALF